MLRQAIEISRFFKKFPVGPKPGGKYNPAEIQLQTRNAQKIPPPQVLACAVTRRPLFFQPEPASS
jgi:hypothetical protein